MVANWWFLSLMVLLAAGDLFDIPVLRLKKKKKEIQKMIDYFSDRGYEKISTVKIYYGTSAAIVFTFCDLRIVSSIC